jgi:3-O-methylgallate 3,4-dioxygenase
VQFGRTLANVLRETSGNQNAVIIASGGLSHTKIDESLDEGFIAALQKNNLDYMAAMRASDLVEGTSEIRNWIVSAAAANRPGIMLDYFPLYRTTTGVGCAMGFAHWDLN